MIGYLEGTVKYATQGRIILFANGIGFTVNLPHNLNFLENQNAKLFIHTHIREDNLALFGFGTPEDLDLFELLITVSGVGPKIALTMLSSSTGENIKKAISESNLQFFSSISGVGKKTAQKIILDLKSKISKGDVNLGNLEGNSELVDSLLALGFQKSEITGVFSQIDSSSSLSTQVKTALKLLKK
ncbi:MAG TPA: Holliday junction branch migration protein RuvA [Candidatus Woesebacteria bacterium]|nr:Holliday junction branch migration protein RuvA [Candidatus Woesebacteria bacterium]